MGCGASTGDPTKPVNEGKYPNKFFKAHAGPVDEAIADKATSADPIFEIEGMSTVYLLRYPTVAALHNNADQSPYTPSPSSAPRESWTLFNDSKSSAKFSVTFFRATHIAVLCADDPDGAVQANVDAPFSVQHGDAKAERKGEGESQRLILSLTLKPSQTVPLVDGVESGGYMWKCLVTSRNGDLMATPVERP